MSSASNSASTLPLTQPIWALAQGVSVVSAVGVVLLLVVSPQLGLSLTWDLLVPLVPLVLLVAPRIWRNLCPISVVHQLPVRLGRSGTRRPGARAQRWAPAIAAGLLALIVPLRLVFFNQNGPALAVFVVTVLVLALLGGLLFAGKAGWCTTVCPVLPVERLYGQDPFAEPVHAHCTPCVGCTRGCPDLEARESIRTLAGLPSGRSGRAVPDISWWTTPRRLWATPTGLFALAFPGFVAGYFLAPPEPGILGAYAWTLGGAIASLILSSAVASLPRMTPPRSLRLGAAAAFILYYWFTVPTVLDFLLGAAGTSASASGTLAGQAAFAGLAGAWFWRGNRNQAGR